MQVRTINILLKPFIKTLGLMFPALPGEIGSKVFLFHSHEPSGIPFSHSLRYNGIIDHYWEKDV